MESLVGGVGRVARGRRISKHAPRRLEGSVTSRVAAVAGQLEQLCHLSLWPKLTGRLRRLDGPAVPVGSLVRVVAQEHVPRLAEVLVLVRRGGRVVAVAMRLDGAKGR